jgi:hypothetical protein
MMFRKWILLAMLFLFCSFKTSKVSNYYKKNYKEIFLLKELLDLKLRNANLNCIRLRLSKAFNQKNEVYMSFVDKNKIYWRFIYSDDGVYQPDELNDKPNAKQVADSLIDSSMVQAIKLFAKLKPRSCYTTEDYTSFEVYRGYFEHYYFYYTYGLFIQNGPRKYIEGANGLKIDLFHSSDFLEIIDSNACLVKFRHSV